MVETQSHPHFLVEMHLLVFWFFVMFIIGYKLLNDEYIFQKRRVTDLLSSFIPDDETALLKNGRYTCLVCSYRPVFDTVEMLTLHRKGKKHFEGMKYLFGKKTQVKNGMAKRRHENYVQAEDGRQDPPSSAPLLNKTRKLTHNALLKTASHYSCNRNSRTSSDSSTTTRSVSSQHPQSSVEVRDMFTLQGTQQHCQSTLSDQLAISPTQYHSTKTKTKEKCDTEKCQEIKHLTPGRRREMEHHLKLKSAGWLQDTSGQWLKDDNVEFDSDEEYPSALPPLSTKSNKLQK